MDYQKIFDSDMPDEIKGSVFALAGMAGGLGSLRGAGVLDHALRTWERVKSGQYENEICGLYVDARCGSCVVDVKALYDERERVAMRMSYLKGLKPPIPEEPPTAEQILKEIAAELTRETEDIEDCEIGDQHDSGVVGFRLGENTYRGYLSEDHAEEAAIEYLQENKELWNSAVEAGNTSEGLSEWAQTIVNLDGWENALGAYEVHYLGCGVVFWEE